MNCIEDLSQKILKILKNEAEFLDLRGLAGNRVKERFSWDKIANQFDQYYYQIKSTSKK